MDLLSKDDPISRQGGSGGILRAHQNPPPASWSKWATVMIYARR